MILLHFQGKLVWNFR